jgi:hypothetical protein
MSIHKHISTKQLELYHSDKLTDNELFEFLTSTSECTDCTQLLADSFNESKLSCTSANFTDNTINIIAKMEVSKTVSTLEKNKILFFHSLKIGFGAAVAIFFISTNNILTTVASDAMIAYNTNAYIKSTTQPTEQKLINPADNDFRNQRFSFIETAFSNFQDSINNFFIDKEINNE